MNEFTAKKLGEVLAFCRAGEAIVKRGKLALYPILNYDYDNILEKFDAYGNRIEDLARELGNQETTLAKSEKTKNKLMAMAEMYIGDEWDNSAELLEWFGFFEGAAIIHWKLVQGSAITLQNKELLDLVEENISFHTKLLDNFGEKIREYASNKTI